MAKDNNSILFFAYKNQPAPVNATATVPLHLSGATWRKKVNNRFHSCLYQPQLANTHQSYHAELASIYALSELYVMPC